MKLVSTDFGQVLQLMNMDEMRPLEGLYLPDFVKGLQQRYQFAVVPNDLLEALKTGAKFHLGKKTIGDRTIVIKELGVYNDGLLISTTNTGDSDALVDDCIKWAIDEFGLRPAQTIIPRQYTSTVVIDFEQSVDKVLGQIEIIKNLLSYSLKSRYEWSYPISLTGISFGIDPQLLPQDRNSRFSLEKRVGIPFSHNRYFSAAPLPTEEHLKLLEQIEETLFHG
jgi:hypothetical protein